MLDPDRFFRFAGPGSQEWWYFDAISDDGEYALVIVWYAGLPFDPDYGLATLRHLRNPARYPAPDPLDHTAIGLSLYHRGKTVAYALNRYGADRFRHSAEPFSIEVGKRQFDRESGGYHLHVETPAQDGRRLILADLTFTPASATESIERNLGARVASINGSWRWPTAGLRVE